MAETRVAIIPAQSSSRGVARRHLRPVGGRPLLAYTVEAAQRTGIFDEVIATSDRADVLRYAAELGATTLESPADLSVEDVPPVRLVLHVIRERGLDPETVVSMLLPTCPLRTGDDIANALRAFGSSYADSLVSVYRDRTRLFDLRRRGPDGLLIPLFGGDPTLPRRDVQDQYVVNESIYISTVASLLSYGSFHRGRVMPFLMERSRSVDVTTLEDLAHVERMLRA